MNTTTAAVSCADVSVRLGGRLVVDSLSLDVFEGEWVTIVGPNGAGKTTLLNTIAGVQRFDGTVELAGTEVGTLGARARARRVGRVPQHPVLPGGMTLVDYVLLGRTPHLGLLGTEGRQDLDVVAYVLDRLDLTPLAGHFLETLSGGELQRCHIARAIAQETPILLLDEPTTALDLGHQQEALELVDELRHERRLTVLSTMHDLTLAGQYSDRLVLLKQGAVVAVGPASEVLTSGGLSDLYGASVRVVREDGDIVVLPTRSTENAT